MSLPRNFTPKANIAHSVTYRKRMLSRWLLRARDVTDNDPQRRADHFIAQRWTYRELFVFFSDVCIISWSDSEPNPWMTAQIVGHSLHHRHSVELPYHFDQTLARKMRASLERQKILMEPRDCALLSYAPEYFGAQSILAGLTPLVNGVSHQETWWLIERDFYARAAESWAERFTLRYCVESGVAAWRYWQGIDDLAGPGHPLSVDPEAPLTVVVAEVVDLLLRRMTLDVQLFRLRETPPALGDLDLGHWSAGPYRDPEAVELNQVAFALQEKYGCDADDARHLMHFIAMSDGYFEHEGACFRATSNVIP